MERTILRVLMWGNLALGVLMLLIAVAADPVYFDPGGYLALAGICWFLSTVATVTVKWGLDG